MIILSFSKFRLLPCYHASICSNSFMGVVMEFLLLTLITHLLFESVIRGVFRTLPNIKDGTFCENSDWLKACNYFWKKLHFRCFWMLLWFLRLTLDVLVRWIPSEKCPCLSLASDTYCLLTDPLSTPRVFR